MTDIKADVTAVGDDPQARVNAHSAALIRLAAAHGVYAEYTSWDGEERRSSSKAIRAALAAMGVAAGDDAQCQRELDTLEDKKWLTTVPPVTVVREGEAAEVHVHADHSALPDVNLVLENGVTIAPAQLNKHVEPREVEGQTITRATFQLPSDLPLGWHTIEVNLDDDVARGVVVVTPDQLEVPAAVRNKRPWGFMTQLYSVRSERSWGLGDLADLRDLCTLSASRAGADFVLVNPLHAAEPVPPLTASPYLPSSRQFVNPLYIRVEDIPEVAYMTSAERAVLEWKAEALHAASTSAALLDRDAAWEAKIEALEEVFKMPRNAAREAQFRHYVKRRGWALEDFATWCAIAEERSGTTVLTDSPGGPNDGASPDDRWPDVLATPVAPGVTAFREIHAKRVEFFAWLQWLADEQRSAVQVAARRAGMSIGVIGDLAVGVHPTGADAWALGHALVRGVSVGAPPDLFNQQGQNWSQPPWHPRALEDAAYLPFREMVRASLRHVGAVRVDHIMGLFRLWWVPEGHSPDDGVYVRYDHEAMVGILALEAHRAGAMVIGEDLGTVEPWVSGYLKERGILGTTVLWFENDAHGNFSDPAMHRAEALATITTHDHPTTASFLSGEHVDVRNKLGLLVEPYRNVREDAARDRTKAVAFLEHHGFAGNGVNGDVDPEQDLLIGLHRAVMASPALLTGISLADAVGERKAQNQPGTDREYPNWRIPLTDARGGVVMLDNLFDHPRMQALVAALNESR